MKTEVLIRLLAADASRPVIPVGQVLFRALGLGAALSIAIFLMTLHPRPDLTHALLTLPFAFKLTLALLVATTAALFLTEAARPVAPHRWRWALFVAPLLLAGGVLVELATVPAAEWTPRLAGRNGSHCLSLIPLLAVPPLACLFAALRRAAPLSPVLAGSAAGLVSGGVGASLYALTCPDDSPLFVATWYSLAIAIVTMASAHLGGRFLRW